MINEDVLKKADVLISEIKNSDLDFAIKITLLRIISNKVLAAVKYLIEKINDD